MVAIDDTGSGYSNLRSIAELQPDFIKLDMSLIRDVRDKPILQAILEAFVTLSARNHANLVAEGVESQA